MDGSDFILFRKPVLLFIVMGIMYIPGTDGSNRSQLQTINKNEMGMEPLYKMVHTFLGDIVHTKNISDSFINLTTVFVDGDFDKDTLTDWKEWMKYLIGFSVCAAIGVLFIVVMPITGFIFCCCRLCGKCGGQKRVTETKRSKCKRRTYCTLLLVFNTLALAGVVCAFICNSLIYKNLKNDNSDGLVGHLQNSLNHISNFADDAVQNVSSKTVQTVSDVSKDVIRNIDETGDKVIGDALASLNATEHLNEADEISKDVNKTREKLDHINTLLSEIIDETKALQENLTRIKHDVETACSSSCNIDSSQYTTDANFSKLGDLSTQAKNVASAMNMDTYIQKAKNSIDNAQSKAKTEIKTQTDSASESIERVNSTVRNRITDLRDKKDDIMKYLRDANNELNDADNTIKDKADYVYYGGIGVCCAYLLIVVLYYISILFGLCGERPGEGAPCCNTGTGSSFLMAGVSFTFIFSWIFMLLCLVLFVFGGLSYTEVCHYFIDHDPVKLKVFDDTLNNGLDLSGAIFKNKSAKFSISNSLKECQNHQAVYSALDLHNVVDLDNITRLDDFKKELDELKKQNVLIENVTIIDNDLRDSLLNFSNAGLENFNFTPFIIETQKNITVVDLHVLAVKVQEHAKPPLSNDRQQTLISAAAELDDLSMKTIPNIETKISNLRSNLTSLQNDNSSFKNPIMKLISDLQASQNKFNTEKTGLISKALNDLTDMIYDETSFSVDKLKEEIETKIAPCDALSDAFFALTDSACVLAVDPLNGLWFSFGWCLFFFVLCLIFAVLLASQYRCEHKYEKEFDDPNFVMYGGPNPDTIPLTSLEQQSGRPYAPYGYPNHSGMANSAYSHETKPYSAPPPYGDHMHQGIAAYAYPPPEYNGHQHHDLASAYPAVSQSGNSSRDQDFYYYPY